MTACPADRARGRVKQQIAHSQDGWPLARPATDEGTDAGPQLLDLKWLGDIVVGTRI
jgi:hypothetical protein